MPLKFAKNYVLKSYRSKDKGDSILHNQAVDIGKNLRKYSDTLATSSLGGIAKAIVCTCKKK